MGRLAGRGSFEELDRQGQQAPEHVNVQTGIDPGRHHFDDLAPRVADQRFVDRHEDQHERDQRERRHRVVGENPVECRHDQEWRQDLQNADRQGGGQDLAEIALLREDEPGEPTEREGGLVVRRRARAADEKGLAVPDPLKAQLVDLDAGAAGARRSLDEADASLTIAARDEGGMPVGKKHNDGADVFQPHELGPAHAHRPGPEAGRRCPCRERGRRRYRTFGLARVVGGIEVSAMVVCDPHDRHDTRLRLARHRTV